MESKNESMGGRWRSKGGNSKGGNLLKNEYRLPRGEGKRLSQHRLPRGEGKVPQMYF